METMKQFFELETVDVVGSAENPNGHIYQLCDSGVMVRRVYIDTPKGGKDLHIGQITDTHLTHWNLRDFEEKHPSVLSTIEHRRSSFKREDTFLCLANLMQYAPLFDKFIVTGDMIDYLTWGSLDYINRYIYEKCPKALLSVGGHDISRVTQGKIPDTSSVASRYDILRYYFRNDLFYHSEVMDNRVMLIVLNNGECKYYPEQVEKFRKDLQKAKEENLVILIFQHEPICTRNQAELNIDPLFAAASYIGNRNYCERFIGSAPKDDATDELYRLITENADLIKGIFCGHMHYDAYTEIKASYQADGETQEAIIPQYVLSGAPYQQGHMLVITIR